MLSILDYITSLISPKEAEAKITGEKEAIKIIKEILEQSEQKQDDYLYDMYKKIIHAAEKRPETVEIHQAPGLAQSSYSAVATHEAGKIHYDPSYTNKDLHNVIPHELMHFLNFLTDREPEGTPVATQHDFIKSLLGTDSYKPASELQGYEKPTLNIDQLKLYQRMMGEAYAQ